MRVPGRVFGFLSLALLVFPGQSVVRADFTTPIQTETVPLTQTDWGPALPPPVHPTPPATPAEGFNKDPLIFAKFDPAAFTPAGAKKPAVLESVKITLDYTFENQLSMTFKTSSPVMTSSRISETTNGFMDLTRPDTTKPIFSSSPHFTNTLGPTTRIVSAANPVTVTGPLKTFTGSVSQVLTSPADLALFQGTGTIGLPLGASALDVYLARGLSFGTSSTRSGAVVTVQYTYSLVPEPSSMALLGLGGGSLLMFVRSRRRSARV